MRRIKCKSGIEGWRERLQKCYSCRGEWDGYCAMYNLHVRLGYKTPEEAWEANPMIEGSVKPDDFRKVS